MARQKCEAYKIFEKNLDRARAFVRVFDKRRRGVGQPPNDDKELLRGAVVFAIGALDALLHELILEIVPAFGGDRSALADALRAIAKDDPSLALRVSLATDAQDRRTEFRGALDSWLERKSFQGAERVAIALQYLGCSLTLTDLDTPTGHTTADRLEHFTKMRHNIVHRGLSPKVLRSSADECLKLVEKIARAINSDVVGYYSGTKSRA